MYDLVRKLTNVLETILTDESLSGETKAKGYATILAIKAILNESGPTTTRRSRGVTRRPDALDVQEREGLESDTPDDPSHPLNAPFDFPDDHG